MADARPAFDLSGFVSSLFGKKVSNEPSCEYPAVAVRSTNEPSGEPPVGAVLSKYKTKDFYFFDVPRSQGTLCDHCWSKGSPTRWTRTGRAGNKETQSLLAIACLSALASLSI